MNKLKKVGLTALATTLVASSAYAGELSVSGSAGITYSGISSASDANPFSMGNSVKFNGGGDLDNGMSVAVYYELDDDIMDDYNLTLDLGGSNGTFTFSGDSMNAGGVDAVKDIVPYAYTPVYEETNSTDNGLATTSGRNQTGMLGYANSVGPLAVSLGYNPKNSTAHADTETSIGITYTTPVDGLTAVVGRLDDGDVAENDTYGLKYTMGNVTAAYQITKVNFDATGTADQDAQHYGISMAVNENLSVSAGRQVVEIDNAVDDEINTGIQASYTMGSISIGGAFNAVDSAGGTAGSDVEATLLNVSFAF
jgi:outer membrane protein OmpU